MYQLREIKTLNYASHVAQYSDDRLVEVWMLRESGYVTLTPNQFRTMVRNAMDRDDGTATKVSELALIAVLDAPTLFFKGHRRDDRYRRNDRDNYHNDRYDRRR